MAPHCPTPTRTCPHWDEPGSPVLPAPLAPPSPSQCPQCPPAPRTWLWQEPTMGTPKSPLSPQRLPAPPASPSAPSAPPVPPVPRTWLWQSPPWAPRRLPSPPSAPSAPSGSPAHAFPSCMGELAAFSCNFTGSLCHAPFLSGFLLYQSGWASCHSRPCPASQEEDYTSVPVLTYSRIWKRNYN